MRINHNIPALRTLHQMNKTNANMDKTMQRLSSGLRINSASDDAAGLAISQKMETQVRGLQQANRNSMDGISLIQTAEGALNEVHSMLQRMRELAVQASNGTLEDKDRGTIQDEIDQLIEEIDRTAENTEYNKQTLLNGDLVASGTPLTGGLDLQIGANEKQMMKIGIEDMRASALGVSGLDLAATQSGAALAITTIDKAIAMVSSTRSKLGAYQNRLEHVVANLDVAAENMTESMSRIRDADMAKEMSEYTKQNILAQAGNSMLAQANQRPQQILQLLQ
ncbi:MAG TPA: flagellin [Epulopiscium sp.]|nr:flagellin [Candidatus Epulonipiscium sp.]